MKTKPFIIGSLATFVTVAVLNMLLHGVVLSKLYEITKDVWRVEGVRGGMMPLMYLSYLLISFVFVYLFGCGYRGKGWAEGVRFGLIFGMAMAFAGTIEKFVYLDIPVRLALGWFMGTLFQYMIMGMITAVIYRKFKEE
ncbi:MAG: hypothetical protein MI748_13330 [Opitutales bacterium]|nr:hypothetical protein [Opitutales bacterium]